MSFVKIIPAKNRPSSAKARQSIRAVFSKLGKKDYQEYSLTLYVGKDVAEKLNSKESGKPIDKRRK